MCFAYDPYGTSKYHHHLSFPTSLELHSYIASIAVTIFLTHFNTFTFYHDHIGLSKTLREKKKTAFQHIGSPHILPIFSFMMGAVINLDFLILFFLFSKAELLMIILLYDLQIHFKFQTIRPLIS